MAKICVDTLELCDLVAGKNIFSEFWKKRKNERTQYRKKKKAFSKDIGIIIFAQIQDLNTCKTVRVSYQWRFC